MKIIDFSPSIETSGLQNIARRAQDLLPIQTSKDAVRIADEIVIQHLKINTSSKYFLLRNLFLEPLNEPIPMVLIGPTGVIVIIPTAIKGIFKAKEDHWYELKKMERNYQPSRPNLVFSTYQMAREIKNKLSSAGIKNVDVQGVLIFTNPGTHVEAVRPSVRIVLADGLNRFASNIRQGPDLFTDNELVKIQNIFIPKESVEDAQPEADLRDQFDFLEDKPKPKLALVRAAPGRPPAAGLTSRFKLSTGQWIFLGILAILQIILLVGIVFLFMM
jgi:hypothetical protein